LHTGFIVSDSASALSVWPASLLKLPDNTVEIGIAGAKLPRKPVPTAPRDYLAVRHHVKLARVPRRQDSFNPQPLLDEGHETRDLCLVVLSRRTVNDFTLILFSNPHQPTLTVGRIRPQRIVVKWRDFWPRSFAHDNDRLRRRDVVSGSVVDFV
jgi:hypothetical protein